MNCCPVCENPIPNHEMERHVNKHFEDDDDISGDLELALQLHHAPPSPSPSPSPCSFDSLVNDIPESSTTRSSEQDEPKDIHVQISYIISLQTKALFHTVQPGFITLLKNCLEKENATTILSGYVDHFQSTWKEDMGWGCGWRNIQMLSSHLLRERPEAREVMFGGSGFVPDIASLQRWLEVAWQRGFDKAGSIYFKGKVYGFRKWIGTTECAAVLRSFGLRAKIVDFDKRGGKKNVGRVCGPMDRFVVRRDLNPDNSHPKPSGVSLQNDKGYQLLIEWVWNYFCKDRPKECGNQKALIFSTSRSFKDNCWNSSQASKQRNKALQLAGLGSRACKDNSYAFELPLTLPFFLMGLVLFLNLVKSVSYMLGAVNVKLFPENRSVGEVIEREFRMAKVSQKGTSYLTEASVPGHPETSSLYSANTRTMMLLVYHWWISESMTMTVNFSTCSVKSINDE
ncbi:hypothetical protein KSS87_023673 [Heliosperma pusillum]|nr:hypothetical protein KSS87_023673 [Heliosperma pusillum]